MDLKRFKRFKMRKAVLLISVAFLIISFKLPNAYTYCEITINEKKHKVEMQMVSNTSDYLFQTNRDLSSDIIDVSKKNNTLEVIQFMMDKKWILLSHVYDYKKRVGKLYFAFDSEKIEKVIINPNQNYYGWRFLWK